MVPDLKTPPMCLCAIRDAAMKAREAMGGLVLLSTGFASATAALLRLEKELAQQGRLVEFKTHTLDSLLNIDYSAIEARVVAGLAGEEWALQAFRAGRDIYVETAARMSTPGNELTRYQGKVAVLALGYNGSVVSLRAMGGEGTDEELGRLVEQWRAANRNIVRMWGTLGEAFRYGGRVGAYLRVEVQGDDRLIWLPSGRAITYHDVELDERFRFLDEKTGKWVTRISDGYANPQGGRTMTYGGKLTENVTQAVARDLLAAALVRLENAGFETVGHVHDEVLVAGTKDVEAVSGIMCDSPEWAAGLPVGSEGFYCYRYRKG